MSVLKKIPKPIGCLLLIPIVLGGLCFATFWVYPRVMAQIYREDIAEVEKMYAEFQNDVQDGHFLKAYEFMSPAYKETHSYLDFSGNFATLAGYHWPIVNISIHGNKGSLFVNYECDGVFCGGESYELIKENGVWYFTGRYKVYYD